VGDCGIGKPAAHVVRGAAEAAVCQRQPHDVEVGAGPQQPGFCAGSQQDCFSTGVQHPPWLLGVGVVAAVELAGAGLVGLEVVMRGVLGVQGQHSAARCCMRRTEA